MENSLSLRRRLFAAACVAAAAWTASLVSAQATRAKVFEGATLIPGDASPPVPGAAFIVENGTITRVGKKGELTAPEGAERVDLTGKFVMPALVDVHTHLGYRRGASFSAENFTRNDVVDELNRFAAFGVAAVGSAGTDRGQVTFLVRGQRASGTLIRTAGRGIAAPDAGPNPPMRDAPYGVSTPDEGRQAVRELAEKKVDFVKIWVDDRNGTVKKLSPAIYTAVIDEAHKNRLRVFAHMTTLGDAKDLLRAGVDGFMHPVRDREVDDELLGLLKQKPAVFFALTLLAPRLSASERPPRWLNESMRSDQVSREEVARLNELVASRKPEAIAAGGTEWDRLVRNVGKLNAAGVKLVLGTDVGGASAGGLFGWAEHAELENMVAAGLTPAQAIAAGTSTAAAVLRIDTLGAIAAGKSADFIVLDRDPLRDITNTRRISTVYLRGREVPQARRPNSGRSGA